MNFEIDSDKRFVWFELSDLIKNNNGLFKNKEQSDELIVNAEISNDKLKHEGNISDNDISAFMNDVYGLDLAEHQYLNIFKANITSDDGRVFDVRYGIVFDEFGVVAKYKLRTSKKPTELKWIRPNGLELPSALPSDSKPAIVDGKFHISGKVKTIKEEANQYSYYGETVLKMLIETASGNRLWGSVPKKLYDDIDMGKKVSFDAEVQVSNKDNHFGFFKRPKNMKIIDQKG